MRVVLCVCFYLATFFTPASSEAASSSMPFKEVPHRFQVLFRPRTSTRAAKVPPITTTPLETRVERTGRQMSISSRAPMEATTSAGLQLASGSTTR